MTDVTWDAATIERLRQMRAEGMGSGPIAKALGCTRNAVIGICRRRGIPTPNRANHRDDLPAKVATPLPSPPIITPKPYVPPPPPVFSEPSQPVPTAALLPHHCRFVVSEDALPFEHCGRHRAYPGYWCSTHRNLVWRRSA